MLVTQRIVAPLYALLLTALAVGCATASKVPEIKAESLPAAAFKAINPRDIKIVVKNTREINKKAENTADVEKAVYDAMSGAMARGGLVTQAASANLLALLIEDYTGQGSESGECVRVTGTLRAKWGSRIAARGSACHYLKRENGFAMAGDVSESYTYALKLVIEGLEQHQMDLLRGTKSH